MSLLQSVQGAFNALLVVLIFSFLVPTFEELHQICRVRSHLSAPSAGPYNLSLPASEHRGPFGVDQWANFVFENATGLFVVESGAGSGEEFSHSLFFETQRGWECLLVEANPHLLTELLSKGRKCHVLRGALSIRRSAGSFPFRLAGSNGGFVETWSEKSAKDTVAGGGGNHANFGSVISVPAFPLHIVMRALQRDVVDFWVLDTEGSEPAILESTDFGSLEVGAIVVEHWSEALRQRRIHDTLVRNGFVRVLSSSLDDYYLSPQYFHKRSLRFPGARQR